MSTIISERVQQYSPKTPEEESHVLKEILQEIILCGLSNAGFFEEAIFQGDTSLRIFHNLGRFSEDLDFILKKPNPDFKWQPFLAAIEETCTEYRLSPEIIDKNKADNVQKMFLKDNSIIKLLNLSFRYPSEQKLTIKLEIDINPPADSGTEIRFLDFPITSQMLIQDLSSNFAGKSHALLCRKYMKGRDWYDFLWYVAKEAPINFIFLQDAINQQGPWAGKGIEITPNWYLTELEKKIHSIDWKEAANEVSSFLNEQDRKTLKLWSIPLFMDRIAKLKNTLDNFFLKENEINDLVKFRGHLNEIEKKLIMNFLKNIQGYFLKYGYKIDGCNVEREKLSNGIMYIFSGNNKQYKIKIGRALFSDNRLNEALSENSTQESYKNLLRNKELKIGDPSTFV